MLHGIICGSFSSGLQMYEGWRLLPVHNSNGMEMKSLSDQGLVNVLVVLDRHVFCSYAIYHSIFTLETEVSKEAFREWYNCLWHILKFPIA